jgi:poly(hydroxyalkanoate) depolymerase family esterase
MKLNEILEATKLTRARRLVEATAAIQRVLHKTLAPRARADKAAEAREAIDADVKVAEAEPAGAPASPLDARLRTPMRREAAMQRVGTAGRRFTSGSFTNHAGTRTYKLYIPDAYSGQPLPLVVMLHGCTQTPDDFALGTGMNRVAEEAGCFVLYPAQAHSANGAKCWNWFMSVDQRRDQGEPAIIADLTREIVRTYKLDARRVYVAGLSAGGAMAAVMANTYPDLYAAAGVHSGLAYAVAHDLPSALSAMRGSGGGLTKAAASAAPVPTIVFHGDRDTTVHPCNADQLAPQAGIVHPPLQASAFTVKVQKGQVPGGHAYTRALHHDASGTGVLEQWTIHGANHAWSGGSEEGSYTDPKGPDASREMMRFFAAQENRYAVVPV